MNPDLWTTHPVVATLSLLPVPLGTLWMAFAPGLVRRFAPRHGAAVTWLTWVVTRPLFAVVVVGLVGHLSVDMTAFFLPQAHAAAAGLVPYRDFRTSYAPLFPLLLAGSLIAGSTGPILLFLLADFGAWRALAAWDADYAKPPLAGAAWAYLAFPPVWYFMVRYSQDEVLAALFLAAALLALARGRETRAWLLLGVGFLATKVLFAVPVLAFALATRRFRWRPALAFALPVVVVYGVLLALRAPIIESLRQEAGSFGVGPTLWLIPKNLLGWDPGLWAHLPWLLVVAGLGLVLRRRGASLAGHGAWGYTAFALLGTKFMPMYVVQWAPLLAVWVAGGSARRRRWWVILGLLLSVTWYLQGGPIQGLFGPGLLAVAWVGLLAVPVAHALGLAAVWKETGRHGRSRVAGGTAVVA